MRITKKHKLYIRHSKTSQLRNLSKFDMELYEYLLIEFLIKGKNEEYYEKNKNVKHWKGWKPIHITLPTHLVANLSNMLNKGFGNEISYDGSWKPLCTLITN